MPFGGSFMGPSSIPGFKGMEPADLFPSTTTWTAPIGGWYKIGALGPGGSGGSVFRATNFGAAGGGGGGGYCDGIFYIDKGTRLSITIGQGGAAVTNASAGTAAAGNAGSGPTLVQGGPVNLYAGPGLGGGATVTDSTTTTVATGGVAAGGDFNYVGGSGGTGRTNATNTAAAAGGGGGAAAPGTNGGNGGNATPANLAAGAGGGGSAGGFNGGDSTSAGGAGAGMGGNGTTNINTGGVNGMGAVSAVCADGVTRATSGVPMFENYFAPFRSLTGGCVTTGVGGPGAGSSGIVAGQPATPGVLGGSGGAARITAAAALGANALLGGGGGGAVGGATGCVSGRGGHGFVTIQRVG